MPANLDPRAVPASFIQAATSDPAASWPGAPPNFGQQVINHISTISGHMGSQGRAYAWADEALRDSRVNAEKMRTDCAIMECLEARMRATALLNWHIVPEDENDPKQKALADDMTCIFRRIPQFTKLRWSLLEALWYGRSGVALQYGSEKIDGKLRTVVKRWEPRHGDKLVFRYDDGSGQYDADQVGIRVGAAYQNDHETQDYLGNRRRKIEATQYGLAYWLDQWERRLIAVHKHIVEDGPWEDPVRAGAIHGVGIRDRIYWTWYGMIECLANVLNYLERSAFGVEIWTYPAGNDQAKQRTEEAAKRVISGGRTVLIVPRFQGEDADLYGVQHIEPGLGGVDAAMSIVREYFGHKIKRYILGQTLSSEPDATGMGSGVADLQAATFADIVKFDAVNLEETITTDLLRWSQLWNFPHSCDTYLRFVIDTDSPDAQRKMEGYRTAWDMGARIREEDVLSTIGASVPKDDDRVLLNPAMQQQQPMSPDGQHYGALSIHGPGLSGGGDAGPANQIPLGPIDPDRYSARDDVAAAAAQTVEPTEAQRGSGNYRKGKVRLHGLDISIENAKGSRRRPEWPPLSSHYGYIRGTVGRDGDHVDCFIGPHPDSELVFVVDQESEGGRFDEHKVMLGFTSMEKARAAYLANYPSGWRCGPVTALTVPQFKAWLASGDMRRRLEAQVSKYTAHWEEQPRDEDGKFSEKDAPSKNPMNSSVGKSYPPKKPALEQAREAARALSKSLGAEVNEEDLIDDPDEWESLSQDERRATIEQAAEAWAESEFDVMDASDFGREVRRYARDNHQEAIDAIVGDRDILERLTEDLIDDPTSASKAERRLLIERHAEYLTENPEEFRSLIAEQVEQCHENAAEFDEYDPERAGEERRLAKQLQDADPATAIRLLYADDVGNHYFGEFEATLRAAGESLPDWTPYRDHLREKLARKGKLPRDLLERLEDAAAADDDHPLTRAIAKGIKSKARRSFLSAAESSGIIEQDTPDLYALMLRADLDRIASIEKYKAGWITIAGGEEDGKKHAGGTRVYIGKGGKILAGPKALEGRKLRDLSRRTKSRRRGSSKGLLSKEDKADILQRFADGDHVDDIGKDHGISGKRVRQIAERRQANTKQRQMEALRNIAREVAGDDEDDQDAFIGMVQDLHRERVQGIEEYNQQLTDFLGRESPATKALRGRIQLIRAKGGDATDIPHFDEAVDHARKYYPALLHVPGESGHDEESALMHNLASGRLPVPRLDDDEIINEALEYAQSRTSDWDSSELEEMRAIPFTARGRPDVYTLLLRRDVLDRVKYAAKWDESKHRRDKKTGRFAKEATPAGGSEEPEGEAPKPPTKKQLPDRKLKGTHATVADLIKDSLTGGGNSKFVDFSRVTDSEADMLREAFGVDASRFVHSISEADIRHALEEHGPGRETAADQEPISADDIALIPEIIADPDLVKPASDGEHYGLQYNKRVNGTLVVIEVVATRKEKLRFKTMRKHKAK